MAGNFRAELVGAIATIAIAIAAAPAGAATIPVNIKTDTVANDANCSLREAVNSAMANSPNAADGCVDGESGFVNGNFLIDVIRLQAPQAGVYQLDGAANDDSNVSGDLDIVQSDPDDLLEIRGDAGVFGPSDSIGQETIADRVIDVNTTSPVMLRTVRIQNGTSPAGENGGGIRISPSTPFTLNLAVVDDNQTGLGGKGGGVYAPPKTGLGGLNVFDSVIGHDGPTIGTGNTASASGGGIHSESPIILNRSVVRENRVTQPTDGTSDILRGGGVTLEGNTTSTHLVRDSFITGNSITEQEADPALSDFVVGGGIELNGATRLHLDSSTLAGNTVNASASTQIQLGGGLHVSANGAVADIVNSTFSGNGTGASSAGSGGAILTPVSTTLNIIHSTFEANFASNTGGAITGGGTVSLRGNVFDQGTTGNSGCAGSGTFTANAENVDEGTTCVGPPDDTDLENTDPDIAPTLAFNGGRTPTHVLNAASPAIDAVPNGPDPDCTDFDGIIDLAVDQRGAERPFGTACDAGAYERVTCNGQLPTILGGAGDDTLTGDSGANVIVGSAGNDTIDGLEESDRICGGSDNDNLTGGAGLDELYGEEGDDELQAREGEADTVDCGPGADMFLADGSLDTVIACETDLTPPPASSGTQGTQGTPASTENPLCATLRAKLKKAKTKKKRKKIRRRLRALGC